MNKQTAHTAGPACPGPYRAEGATVKWISHGIWRVFCHTRAHNLTPQGAQQNAAFIVQACNAHDDLVAALKGLELLARTVTLNLKDPHSDYSRAMLFGCEKARAALAKAGAK